MPTPPAGAMRTPLVSINIPCFRQLDYARRCVASMLAQTLQDFEVTLVDDGASDEYRTYVASLGDARVRYVRNPERLGAMANMFQAIGMGSGAYVLAFHEDDLLGRHYLRAAVGVLEQHSDCGFVAAELREFRQESNADLACEADPAACEYWRSPADFARAVCRGANPMFGSVVYRRAALPPGPPPLAEYGTLVDRPFLMMVLGRWTGALVRQPLVWYRHHGDTDPRHDGMRADHILELLRTYRDALPQPLSAADRALLHHYAGYWLIQLYRLLPAEAQPPLPGFVFRAWREGLYNPMRQRGVGRAGLLRAMVTGR